MSVLLLVCGSRDWTDEAAIVNALARYADRPVTVIHGGARGADRMAGNIARRYGFDVKTYPADWDRYGKRAGILRNLQMLDQEPAVVLAFCKDGSRGTQHTINEARRRGIPVEVTEAA